MTDGFDRLPRSWLQHRPGIKWACARPGELAAWVADMDFPVPEVITKAITDVAAGGDLGYPDLRGGSRLAEPMVDRMQRLHDVELSPGRVREFDDVLNAVQAVLNVTIRKGSRVAIHTPTYPPFLDTLSKMGYVMEPIPFHEVGGRWTFDLATAAEAVERSDAAIIVNPHNPTGRVLDEDELGSLVAGAEVGGTLLIADEVHSDLVYDQGRHVPLARLAPDSITVTSASKAFNLAGMRCAVAHIGSDRAWAALEARPLHLYGAVSNLAVTATLAAWTDEGGAWLDRLLQVLDRNRQMVLERLGPPFALIRPEATYLAWIDASETSLGDTPAREIRRRTGLILTEGIDFGEAGRGFVRLNFATSIEMLSDAIDRVNESLSARP